MITPSTLSCSAATVLLKACLLDRDPQVNLVMVSAARAVDGGQRTTGLGGVTRLSAKVHLNPCLFSNSSSFLTCLFFNPLRGQR